MSHSASLKGSLGEIQTQTNKEKNCLKHSVQIILFLLKCTYSIKLHWKGYIDILSWLYCRNANGLQMSMPCCCIYQQFTSKCLGCYILSALLYKYKPKSLKAAHCHSYRNDVILTGGDPTSGRTVNLLVLGLWGECCSPTPRRPPPPTVGRGAVAVSRCRVGALMLLKGV